MFEIFKVLISVCLGYLIGSIPTAYIFGKLYKGIDIREHGSGNVGATNVFRVIGKGPGIIVLLLDIVKGIVPVVIVSSVLGISEPLYLIFIALSAVCGHNWTIFLKFKGGKGIATSLGVLIGLTIKMPEIVPVLLITLGVWTAVFLITRIVSISSILAAISLPISMVIINCNEGSIRIEVIFLGVIFAIFVVIRHKSNIKRLVAGTEPKIPFNFKKNSKKSLDL